MDSNKLMVEKNQKSIYKTLDEISDYINTWFVSAKTLASISNKLPNKYQKMMDMASMYSQWYYNISNEIDEFNDTKELIQYRRNNITTTDHKVEQKNNHQEIFQENDINDTNDTANILKGGSYSILAENDEIINMITERRKMLEKQKNVESAPIKFITENVDLTTTEPMKLKPVKQKHILSDELFDSDSEIEVTLNEEPSVTETQNISNAETETNTETDKKDDVLFPGNISVKLIPNIDKPVFSIPTEHVINTKYTPLMRLSAAQHRQLNITIFNQAVKNIDTLKPGLNSEERAEAIKAEATRLKEEFLESNISSDSI